jgi:hypothetical protein
VAETHFVLASLGSPRSSQPSLGQLAVTTRYATEDLTMKHLSLRPGFANRSGLLRSRAETIKAPRTQRFTRLFVGILALLVVSFASYAVLSRFSWWPAHTVHAQGTSPFTFTDFDAKDAGTGFMQGTMGTSIDDNGDIAGIYINTNGTATNVAHGFLRTADGTITEFDSPHAGSGNNQGTFPASINASGEIAGMYFDASDAYHGFLRSASGTITEFDVPGAPTNVGHRGTLPISINSGGDIAGLWVDATNDVRHGFVRTAAGVFTSFDVSGAGTVSPQGTVPLSINTAGSITGFYEDAATNFHGFLRAANGTITAPIDAPGAGTGGSSKLNISGTVPASVNTAGDIAGVYANAGSSHGFVYTSSSTTPAFTTFDAPNVVLSGLFMGTVGFSMNAGGDVSGVYTDAQGDHHGFVRAAGGTFTSPVDDPNSAFKNLFSGTILISINATGQMTGTYQDANNAFHAFVAVPASAPADFQLTVSPASLTIPRGQSGTAVFTVTPVNGFNSAVSFTCSGLPAEATCAFNPASVTPNGSAATSTLTVSTTAKSAVVQAPGTSRHGMVFAMLLPLSLLMVGVVAGRQRPASRLGVFSGLIVLALLASGLSCGGSNSSSSGGGNPGTPLGTSTVSVSAATTGGGSVTHAATLTITITQ